MYSLAFSNSDPFDMVIIDLTMPGNIPSCDLLNEFRKIKCVKAVVSSGFINNEIMTNFKDYGFDYSIRKPFTIDELRRCISELY